MFPTLCKRLLRLNKCTVKDFENTAMCICRNDRVCMTPAKDITNRQLPSKRTPTPVDEASRNV